jgi:hypothetical protein
MTHNWFLLSEPWYAYWKRLQVFFFPPSATKDQVKAVRKELVKFMTFQMLTNMYREIYARLFLAMVVASHNFWHKNQQYL